MSMIAYEIKNEEQLEKMNRAYGTDESECPALYIYMGMTENTGEHVLVPHSLEEKMASGN